MLFKVQVVVMLSVVSIVSLSMATSPIRGDEEDELPEQTLTCATVLCTANTSCYDTNGGPRCCPNCPQTFVAEPPVCGSDRKTYCGECALEFESCRAGKKVRKVRDGPCPGTKNPCGNPTTPQTCES